MKKTTTLLVIVSMSFGLVSCGFNQEKQGTMSGMMMDHSQHITNEKDFLLMMIPHHLEAITSSEYMLTRNPSPELRVFLKEVIDAQTREVATMRGWLKLWYGIENIPENNTYQAMMPRLDNLSDSDAAIEYIKGMIEHHQGAVGMAQSVKHLRERAGFASFTDHIATVQTKEIQQLQQMLAKASRPASGSVMRMQ